MKLGLAELTKNGITLVKAKNKGINANPYAFAAGQAAGSHARFDRPVESGGRRMLKIVQCSIK